MGIALTGVLTFWNSLHAPFIYDDRASIVDNPSIRALTLAADPPRDTPVAGRPVVNLSFAVNYAAGGLNPVGYHAVNVALHIVCALLFAGIVRRSGGDDWFAAACALVWLLHPLTTEPVDHITARTESMMTAFVLLAVYAAIRSWQSEGSMWPAAAVAACAAGVACKETAVVTPVLVLLYDRLVRGIAWRELARRRRWLYVGLAASWVLLALLLRSSPRGGAAGFAFDPGLGDRVTPWVYLMNQAPLIVRYLRLVVWPVGLVLDYGFPHPLSLADVWPPALAIAVLLAATLAIARRYPVAAFLGLWFAVTLAPASSIVPIHTEVGAERRMYLPLMAVIVLAALGARALWRRFAAPAGARAGVVAVAGVCVALAALTIRRNAEYASPLSIWQTVVERRPHGRARYNLAIALEDAGRRDAAMVQLRASVADYPDARSVLGADLLDSGAAAEGIAQLEAFVRERPAHYNAVFAHGRLADAYFAQRRYADAIREYREYLRHRSDQPDAWTNLGIALAAGGAIDDAQRAFARVVALRPQDAAAHRNLANALLETGDAAAALGEALEAGRLAPGDAVVGEIAGLARARMPAAQAPATHAAHDPPPPASTAILAVARRPIALKTDIGSAHDPVGTTSKEAQAYYDQGLALLHSYWWLEAARSFNQALTLDPRLGIAYAGLSLAYTELNAPAAAREALAHAQSLAAAAPDHDRRHIAIRAAQMAGESAGASSQDSQRAVKAALDDAIKAYPADEEFALQRGLAESPDPAERGQGSVAASVPFYTKALALAPAHFAAHHYLTHAYENTGRIAEALAEGATYAKMAPGVPHARHMHGHDLRRLGRVEEAIAEFQAADALETAYFKREGIPETFDWHYQHNVDLLAASYQYVGQMKQAEALFRTSFAIGSSLLQQEYNKRAWPAFLIARGRAREALDAAAVMAGHRSPIVSAAGHVMAGEARLALGEFKAAADEANAALRLMRGSPAGAGLVANALQQLQGEFLLRTGQREKGRSLLEDVAGKVRAAPGPDAWTQALFTLESIARTARDVGDWEFAAWAANQMLEHDPQYAGTHVALGLVSEHRGDTAGAEAAFARARRYWKNADPDVAIGHGGQR